MISSDFAYWLSVQGNPTDGSNWVSTSRVLDKASEGDIISVMYHGTDKYALQALKELKHRFEGELHALQEFRREENDRTEEPNEADWD
jgi:hypothetical protein